MKKVYYIGTNLKGWNISGVYRQGEALCFHHGNHIDKDDFYDYLDSQCIHSVFGFHMHHISY